MPTSGWPRLTIAADRIHDGIHRSDTGVYDSRGRFSPSRLRRLFTRFDGDGGLDARELRRLVADNRTDLLGHLGSRAEFGLLLALAGQDRNGKRVLTRERLERLYDGSLFHQLAEEVAARRADQRATLRGMIGSSLREIY